MPAFAKFVAGTHLRHPRQVLICAFHGAAETFRNIEAGMFREIQIVRDKIATRRRTLDCARGQLRTFLLRMASASRSISSKSV